MLKLMIVVAAAAASAAALGLAAGGFLGAAVPQGDMTARDSRSPGFDELRGGDATSSSKFGGTVLIGVLPSVELAFAVARHVNHPAKSYPAESYPTWETLGDTDLTITPVTLGGRYLLRVGPGAFFVGAGGGYYWETMGLVAFAFDFSNREFFGDVSFDGPGAYGEVGARFGRGRFELEVGPRFHNVWNKGRYDFQYEEWLTSPSGNRYLQTHAATITKDYNDAFVDILVGVNYRLW